MKELILKCNQFLFTQPVFGNNWETIKNILDKLNKNQLIIISGFKNVGKLSIIKEFLDKTGLTEASFYFNKELDEKNKIKSDNDLFLLLNEQLKYNKNTKILILHNTNKLEWIKQFISETYKQWYKIILIGNTIKISWKPEIEILPHSINQIQNNSLGSLFKYGCMNEVVSLNNNYYKEKFLNLIIKDYILSEIVQNYWVKNNILYNFTITFLSKINTFHSLREIQKLIDLHSSISLKTTIDYIDFSLETKLLKRCYKYDIKLQKEITSKAKYYFIDNWVRNSLNWNSLDIQILKENTLYWELLKKWYKVYSGISGRFEWTFLWIKWESKIYIHLSEQSNKEEIKKEINKLNKIWDDFHKFLVVENLESLWFRKKQHDTVELLSYTDLLKKLA